jgi:hypothetical protein
MRIIFTILLSMLSVTAQAYEFEDRGPLGVERIENQGPGGRHTIVRPADAKLRMPIIIWGNGLGLKVDKYFGLLEHFASYGFIVIAANTSNTGNGVAMKRGLNWILSENVRPESEYFGKVTTNACVTGHSSGADGTIMMSNHNAVACAAPIYPGGGTVSRIQVPALFIAAEFDIFNSPEKVKYLFNQTTEQAVYGMQYGEKHSSALENGTAGLRHYLTAWFRLHLRFDRVQESVFWGEDCDFCEDQDFSVLRK